MALIVPPGFMHVTQPMRHSDQSDTYNVTYGVRWDSSLHTADEALSDVDGWFRQSWDQDMDSNITFLPATAIVGNDGPPLVAQSSVNASAASRSGSSPPASVATIITKRTAFGGRQWRGRVYMPGLVNTGEAGEVGSISTARLAVLQSAAEAWLAGLAAPGGSLAITPMYLLHGTPQSGGDPPAPTEVTSLLVQNIVGTQRRRIR